MNCTPSSSLLHSCVVCVAWVISEWHFRCLRSRLQVTLAVLVSGWAHVLHAMYKPWGRGTSMYALQHGSLFVTSFVFLMGLLFKVDGVSATAPIYTSLSTIMLTLCSVFIASWLAMVAAGVVARVPTTWRLPCGKRFAAALAVAPGVADGSGSGSSSNSNNSGGGSGSGSGSGIAAGNHTAGSSTDDHTALPSVDSEAGRSSRPAHPSRAGDGDDVHGDVHVPVVDAAPSSRAAALSSLWTWNPLHPLQLRALRLAGAAAPVLQEQDGDSPIQCAAASLPSGLQCRAAGGNSGMASVTDDHHSDAVQPRVRQLFAFPGQTSPRRHAARSTWSAAGGSS